MKLILNSIIIIFCAYVNWTACAITYETNSSTTIQYNFTQPQIVTTTTTTRSDIILNRKRRLAAFPVGSSLSFAAGIHEGVTGSPYGYASMGMLWGVSYNLPNESWILDRLHEYTRTTNNNHQHHHHLQQQYEPEKLIKRRDRRDLYHNLEIIMNKLGFNGRDCILRTLCESGYYFPKKLNNMIIEMIKSVFSFPSVNIQHEMLDYDDAIRQGQTFQNCILYSDLCNFSLLDLALGKYSTNVN